ncbi:MAG: hypothetical protein KW788_01520 [Candidatus Doudnabacteria bacterium]|nr:hypothetical protein [Candidatus Doudnabacteria bacterium]
MSHLLVLYEIAEKASKVTSRKALRSYEKWIYQTIKQYHDAAIEHAARIHLFRLKEQYAV